MNKRIEAYGVTAMEKRPKIKAVKKLDLTGDTGKQIVLSETKLALRIHKNTSKNWQICNGYHLLSFDSLIRRKHNLAIVQIEGFNRCAG